jgi:hypothetical protein
MNNVIAFHWSDKGQILQHSLLRLCSEFLLLSWNVNPFIFLKMFYCYEVSCPANDSDFRHVLGVYFVFEKYKDMNKMNNKNDLIHRKLYAYFYQPMQMMSLNSFSWISVFYNLHYTKDYVFYYCQPSLFVIDILSYWYVVKEKNTSCL